MKYLLFGIILCLSFSVNAQIEELKNDSAKFSIWRTSLVLDDVNDAKPSKNVIRLEVADSTRNKARLLNKSKWIELLENEQTDWVANLFLYELYDKDATKFKIIKNRKLWKENFKKNDIDYWQQFLK